MRYLRCFILGAHGIYLPPHMHRDPKWIDCLPWQNISHHIFKVQVNQGIISMVDGWCVEEISHCRIRVIILAYQRDTCTTISTVTMQPRVGKKRRKTDWAVLSKIFSSKMATASQLSWDLLWVGTRTFGT